MDIFNISQDDDESDTSQEDFPDPYAELDSDSGNSCVLDFQTWKRESTPPDVFTDEHQDFRFFLMDCDFGIISTKLIPPGLIPFETDVRLSSEHKEQSYIRLHGITQSGHSVCCNVFGYLPYFYAVPSKGFIPEQHTEKFKDLLSAAVTQKILATLDAVPYHDMVQSSPPIVAVQVFDVNELKNNIFDLHVSNANASTSESVASRTDILKITCAIPKFVWIAAKILKDNEITYPGIREEEDPCRYEVYEGNINHTVRFLADANVKISPCTWVQLPLGDYSFRMGETRLSHAQIELDAYYENLTKVVPAENSCPPIRILSFDIECMVRPGPAKTYIFPKDGSDLVLQIGNALTTYGTEISAPRKVVFALGECAVSDKTEILHFQKETEMLVAWRNFVLAVDPDIITGFNIKKFDIPYLLDRANRIGLHLFPFLGRVKASPTIVREIVPGPKQMYDYDSKKSLIPGRIIFDLFPLIMRHNTIPGKCSLADVSIRYLKTERKIDVNYQEIFRLQNLSKESRTKLAEYCVQDAVLPILLLQGHNPNPLKNPGGDMLNYYIGKSALTGTLLKYLVNKSKPYAAYVRMVRAQKNPAAPFIPDTPSPLKLDEKARRRRRASSSSTESESELKTPIKTENVRKRRLDFEDSQ